MLQTLIITVHGPQFFLVNPNLFSSLQGHFMYVNNLHQFGHLLNNDNYDTTHLNNDMYQIFDNRLVSWKLITTNQPLVGAILCMSFSLSPTTILGLAEEVCPRELVTPLGACFWCRYGQSTPHRALCIVLIVDLHPPLLSPAQMYTGTRSCLMCFVKNWSRYTAVSSTELVF